MGIKSSPKTCEQISSLFPDAAVLDLQLNFICVSRNVLEALEYPHEELRGNSISMLSDSEDLQHWLRKRLHSGFFAEEQIDIRTKSRNRRSFSISGFYLGMIAEIHGYIVLRFRNMDELNLNYDRLESKTAELDRFVYHSAHALRGPLATIKGLINVGKTSRVPIEWAYLVERMFVFAEELDSKLHRLIFFAESDKDGEWNSLGKDVESLRPLLENVISGSSIDHPVRFQFFHDGLPIEQNAEMIYSLLRNLVLFFVHRPKLSGNALVLRIQHVANAVELSLEARSFLLGTDVHRKIQTANFGYAEILNEAEMINYYAAKKIVFKLRGTMQISANPNNELVVAIRIPVNP